MSLLNLFAFSIFACLFPSVGHSTSPTMIFMLGKLAEGTGFESGE